MMRIVLLGASNLARGISTVVQTSRLLFGSPLEVVGAFGHGRSYGLRSTVLVRTLPAILDCGLWSYLEKSAAEETLAVITDVGNDVMYGQNSATIARWVETCVERLEGVGARIVLTALPMGSLQGLVPWRYEVMRSVLFPTRRIAFDEAMQCVDELSRRLSDLSERRSVKTIELPARWYGVDPIHIRVSCWPEAWSRILTSLTNGATQVRARTSVWRWLSLKRCTPQSWRLCGVDLSRTQPAGRLKDGTVVAMF